MVLSLCIVSLSASLGVIALFSHVPTSYLLSFVWVNLVVWAVGISLWVTLGVALVAAVRSRRALPRLDSMSHRAKHVVGVGVLGVVTVIGTLVVVFPYGNQFLLDWQGVTRVEHMTTEIQQHVPKGPVGIGVRYSGNDYFQAAEDEHGTAYLLLVGGWLPGMEPSINQLLGLPIHPKSPFVVFNEHGQRLISANFYRHYFWYWFSLNSGD